MPFYDILARACAEINFLREKVTYVFRLFDFLNFFLPFLFLLFFSFCLVIDLLLGLLAIKNFQESVIKTGNCYHGAARCSGRVFRSTFLSIFLNISGSIRPITLIWASLERYFPPAEVEYR